MGRLKHKYRKRAETRSIERLKVAGVLDEEGNVKKYTPERLKIDYGKSMDKFRKEHGDRLGNYSEKGRFLGGTISKYRDRSGNLQQIRQGPQTRDRFGRTRTMGSVQDEANARFKRKTQNLRTGDFRQLKNKLNRREY